MLGNPSESRNITTLSVKEWVYEGDGITTLITGVRNTPPPPSLLEHTYPGDYVRPISLIRCNVKVA